MLRRVENRTMPRATVMPVLVYEDVEAAIEWICAAFGFRERWRAGGHRAQLGYRDGTAVLADATYGRVAGGGTEVLVRVEDVDAHHAQAVAHGAEIARPPADHPYGERQYTAVDPGGNRWTFSQSIADVVPEDWGGTSGDLDA
jgi:uncharacterized glyoxalase superfamily protein PhnB